MRERLSQPGQPLAHARGSGAAAHSAGGAGFRVSRKRDLTKAEQRRLTKLTAALRSEYGRD